MGGRYAQALFDLATEDRNLSAVEADLKALKSMRASSKDFRTLLASPAFSAEEKGRAIAALAAILTIPAGVTAAGSLSITAKNTRKSDTVAITVFRRHLAATNST